MTPTRSPRCARSWPRSGAGSRSRRRTRDALGLGQGKDGAPASDFEARSGFGFHPPRDDRNRCAGKRSIDALGIVRRSRRPLVDERSQPAAAYAGSGADVSRKHAPDDRGQLVAEQVGEAIGQPDLAIRVSRPYPDISADLRARSRALVSQAGMTIEEAREVVGL